MDLEHRSIELLKEWNQYKNLHYSNKTNFSNAIDIEVEKDSIAIWATFLLEALTTKGVPEEELRYRIDTFEHLLATHKDRLTFELLKNGIA